MGSLKEGKKLIKIDIVNSLSCIWYFLFIYLCDAPLFCCPVSSNLYLGMPYPQNLETAKELMAVVTENGAVPATIAIMDGIPCVGMHFERISVTSWSLNYSLDVSDYT